MKRILFLTLAFVILICPACSAFAAEVEGITAEQLLSIAREAMAAGDTETALPIYNRLVAENPDNTELRLEAARAHYAAGNETEAIRLGHEVLKEYEKQRLQIQGVVRTGVLYDSNANQGPASNNIRLGIFPEVILKDGKAKSSAGAYVGANVDVAYRMSAISPWWWVGDMGVFWRGYANSDLNRNNSREWQWGRVGAGLRFMNDRDLLDVRVKAEIFDYEFETNVTALGAELRYTHAISQRLQLILDAGLDSRGYSDNDDHDGNFFHAGGFARYIFGEALHEFLIGASYFDASASRDRYAYDGWQALARFNFKLSQALSISPSISFAREYYNGPATALETEDRQNDRLRAGLELAYAINPTSNIEASYYYTNTDSTSNLYTYDQHMLSLGMAWKF